jgi:protein SCO1/2
MLTGTPECGAGLLAGRVGQPPRELLGERPQGSDTGRKGSGSPANARAGTGRESPSPAAVRFFGISLAACACAALAVAVFRPVQILPLLRPAPPMTLREGDGSVITSAHLGGTVFVFHLSALRCLGPCGNGHAALHMLQRRLEVSPPAVPVRLLTVLLDSSVSPAALRARQAALGADPRWWRVATADATQLKNMVGAGFGVYYAADGTGRVAFEPATFLVDERGIVRAEYPTASLDPARIGRDLDLVLREASSWGAARAAYAAAHLFLCYPR